MRCKKTRSSGHQQTRNCSSGCLHLVILGWLVDFGITSKFYEGVTDRYRMRDSSSRDAAVVQPEVHLEPPRH